jgi:hypothetical protein
MWYTPKRLRLALLIAIYTHFSVVLVVSFVDLDFICVSTNSVKST